MIADANSKKRRLSQIACFIALQCAVSVFNPVAAREYFNPALLGIDGPGKDLTDLSAFEDGVGQMPGSYRVDVFVNKTALSTQTVNFTMQKGATGQSVLRPCLSIEDLKGFGVRTELFPQLSTKGECADLSAIPQASSEFAFNRQQLLLSIPQAAMDNHARGYVPPERLDEGINALLLNYNFTGANTQARKTEYTDSDSYYLNLRPGINLGAWRLRNYSTWSRNSSGGQAQDSWDSVYTYAQRNILALKGQLTLGDSSSPSDMFDSVPFRGAQIASDDDMLPESMRGYAPVVRGIARTNAQVIVKQNGYTIYQTYVSAGAFAITDMYPTGSSGDLDVTIKEADGSEQHQIVPFASLPVLQREGRLKYSLTSGQYRSYNSDVDKEYFTQGTAIYGLPAGLTLYGGGQFSQHYQSILAGIGKNLGVMGAFSVDAAQAWSKPQDQEKASGQSVRARYSKNILDTGTNISISGYRYSTSGYYTLQDTLDTWRSDNNQNTIDRRRNRAEILLNQNLWKDAGSISLNAVSEDYWNSARQMRSIGVGYSNSWSGITYNLNYSYNRNTTDNSSANNSDNSGNSGKVYASDQVFSFNINIPLDRWLSHSWASYNLNTSKQGNTSHTVGLNGSALADQNLNWSVQESETNHGVGNGGYASLDYQGTYARMNAAYGYDQDQRRVNYGINGGVVAHAHGVTFSQELGETSALVEAPGVSGVNISNQTGVNTDFRGYTLVPYVSPYRENQISLDTTALPDDADVSLSSLTVTPTRGAIVRAHFNTHIGKRVLMTLTRSNGAVVPFGAMVADDGASASGSIVGDGGQVYLSGLADRGSAIVKWGQTDNQQCRINWQLPDAAPANGVVELKALCQ
ncbi:fimbria/pilus outer membrane usher protein [Pluralibacter sp.]|uniref:fimbria/pilus outer membrane usher protein n=1 Tax=Pluralibacter sp. TaxID=1920032 RepID=UPI0025E90736|nr:fimbria/pilus outer membrane usher protein [Pluralibacter sp.]MBV8042160.1 fimbrial biogenesis outer membrane usher protein [Pluralibacter sp.]